MDGEEILSPEHAAHHEISWIGCIVHRCRVHVYEKLAYRWLPGRFDGVALTSPYLASDVGYLVPIYRDVQGFSIFEAQSE
ncbi:hypothetical protein F4678DRAFT_426580 [Xylaria arbuscula]|nr:hypothetical protein F4678DRAFT_426580 [Xylaria arbuscula]